MEGLNERQRKFARLYVSGLPGGRAYEKAGYEARGNIADSCASELLRVPKVSEFIEKLRDRISGKDVLTLEEALEFLSRTVRTPIGEIDEESDLAQEVTYETRGGTARGRLKRGQAEAGNEVESVQTEVARIKGISKIEALKQMALMLGWNKPQKMEITAEESLRNAFAGLAASALPNDRDQI